MCLLKLSKTIIYMIKKAGWSLFAFDDEEGKEPYNFDFGV